MQTKKETIDQPECSQCAPLAEALTACQQEHKDCVKQRTHAFAVRYAEEVVRDLKQAEADLTACRAQGEAMRAALENLVTKLDAMQEPLNGICVIGSIHGMPYTGPNWGDEITAARAALSSTPTEPA